MLSFELFTQPDNSNIPKTNRGKIREGGEFFIAFGRIVMSGLRPALYDCLPDSILGFYSSLSPETNDVLLDLK